MKSVWLIGSILIVAFRPAAASDFTLPNNSSYPRALPHATPDFRVPSSEAFDAWAADSYLKSETDPIFNEVLSGNGSDSDNLGSWSNERDKRGALELARIIQCATGCDPLIFKGYGCYCGFLGSGEPVDGIDLCCKMHDWCYTVSTCMDLQYHLPYFVPFRWKCNGGSPYCIPGKTESTNRDSCSHHLCECDREFAMCLQRHLPCPTSRPVCDKSAQRQMQTVIMSVGTGSDIHHHTSQPKPTYSSGSISPASGTTGPTTYHHNTGITSQRRPKLFGFLDFLGKK